MNKLERAKAALAIYELPMTIDERVQQLLYDLRAYCKFNALNFEEQLKKSEIPFETMSE
jgi:hypothetical protein